MIQYVNIGGITMYTLKDLTELYIALNTTTTTHLDKKDLQELMGTLKNTITLALTCEVEYDPQEDDSDR
jgi:hypothetical protein